MSCVRTYYQNVPWPARPWPILLSATSCMMHLVPPWSNAMQPCSGLGKHPCGLWLAAMYHTYLRMHHTLQTGSARSFTNPTHAPAHCSAATTAAHRYCTASDPHINSAVLSSGGHMCKPDLRAPSSRKGALCLHMNACQCLLVRTTTLCITPLCVLLHFITTLFVLRHCLYYVHCKTFLTL